MPAQEESLSEVVAKLRAEVSSIPIAKHSRIFSRRTLAFYKTLIEVLVNEQNEGKDPPLLFFTILYTDLLENSTFRGA